MSRPFTALTLGVVLLLAPASHAVSSASEDRTVIFGSAHGSVPAIPALAAGTARPGKSVRGTVSVIDERNDRLALRLPNDGSEDFKVESFKVQDGLLFNSVRFGDEVEASVENSAGVRTILRLTKE